MVKLRVVDEVYSTGYWADLVDILPIRLFIKNVSVGVLERDFYLCRLRHTIEKSWVQIQNRLPAPIVWNYFERLQVWLILRIGLAEWVDFVLFMDSGYLCQVRWEFANCNSCVIVTEHVEHLLTEHCSFFIISSCGVGQVLFLGFFNFLNYWRLSVDRIRTLALQLVKVWDWTVIW